MTHEERVRAVFHLYRYEYLQFDRIPPSSVGILTNRADVAALVILDQILTRIFPGVRINIITRSYDGVIYLCNISDLAGASDDEIKSLIRCGILCHPVENFLILKDNS